MDDKNIILFHAVLAEREFGSDLLSVAKLTAWAQEKGLELATLSDINGFRFVQAKALLCAIERSTNSTLTPDQAAKIVRTDPELSKHRALTDPVNCH